MTRINRINHLVWIFILCFFLTGCTGKNEISFEKVSDGTSAETQLISSECISETETTASFLYVDVAGAVKNPGVVKLPAGSRIYEAIEKAGGFSAQAKRDSVNQAAFLTDGQQLYVYTEEEYAAFAAGNGNTGALQESSGLSDSSDGKVNINQASETELMTLPGIGQSKAADILRYREENGRFEKIEDIMNISGIKEAVFSKIKDKITVQ